jgi:CheY-like chemotaxis protein
MTCDHLKKRTVVVVDENAEYREILVDLLAHLPGLHVAAFGSDGMDAVELCTQHHPDFLLLDSGMAGFGAIRAAADVRRITPETIIIFLTTGDAWQPDSDVGFAAGDRVVSKSDIKAELLAMLQDKGGRNSVRGI